MTDALFSAVELGPAGRAGYRLQHLEVLNWGTFDRRVWRFTANAETALLTGDIGSGKSTLVDALTTLLLPAHKIAYNKAAGADVRERTLRSYVEGHYKSGRVETTGRSRAIGLRSGSRTYSVVLGVFANDGYDETITLAQVFQQRESAGQPYRFFVTADKELSIGSDFADFGSDLRDLRRRLRAGGAVVYDDFPKYGTAFRRLLGIGSDQALELFHQTVSMKSVGNLNDFVRDHMLEPSDASERVRDIISHFEDLTKAHDAVRRAREQLEALDPLASTAARYDATLAERDGLERERAAVRIFVTELRSRLLTEEIATSEREVEQTSGEQTLARTRQRELAAERDRLIEERARAGGDRIGELERLSAEARRQTDRRTAERARFVLAVGDAELPPINDGEGFAALTTLVAEHRPRLEREKKDLDHAFADAIGREKDLGARSAAIGDELTSLAQRTSNLPSEQVQLRAQLCADLGLTAEDLPYAGELLDVADAHAQWRGAAERVLRGFALSLLVPQQHYDAVSQWVNSHRLEFRGRDGGSRGARLVYERVSSRRIPLQRRDHDGLLLADCIEAKEGPFQDYLVNELARRADHHCASNLTQFRAEHRAVTPEGQIRSGDRHEKDDRHRVDDPRRWVLGWANERKIIALQTERAELESARETAVGELAGIARQRDALQRRRDAITRLDGFASWTDLDVEEASARATEYDAERARLEAGSSRLEEITRALESNAERAASLSQTLDRLTGELATVADRVRRAKQDQQRCSEDLRSHPAEELVIAREAYGRLEVRLGPSLPTRSADCAAAESDLSADLHRRIERLTRELGGYITSLHQYMGVVLQRWPELRADLDASVDARADFIALRDRVATDDLPKFESEFKEQLNKNAIQELAGFNSWLNRQATAIDERVGRINEALGAVPYNPGHYIRLEKEPTTHSDVTMFRSDLRNLTNDSLVVDGDQYSEQRFLDVKRIIERFRGREGYAESDKAWTRRVTDVRNWFVFSASERDAETHEEWEHFSDSDGKSGGQKEKLAYTILAASLAYQFGLEWGVTKSKDFRFAVIDEAFGRGSDASTRYALELFAKLGLQLLIITPLQKVHVIEPYVRAIGFVDNPTGTSSRMETMTIEDYRQRRDEAR